MVTTAIIPYFAKIATQGLHRNPAGVLSSHIQVMFGLLSSGHVRTVGSARASPNHFVSIFVAAAVAAGASFIVIAEAVAAEAPAASAAAAKTAS